MTRQPEFSGLTVLQQRTARAAWHLRQRGLSALARYPELLLTMTEFAEETNHEPKDPNNPIAPARPEP